jgi:hypothetical protein
MESDDVVLYTQLHTCLEPAEGVLQVIFLLQTYEIRPHSASTIIFPEFTISHPTAVQADARCVPVGDTKMYVNAPFSRLDTDLGVPVSQSVPSVDRVTLRKRHGP